MVADVPVIRSVGERWTSAAWTQRSQAPVLSLQRRCTARGVHSPAQSRTWWCRPPVSGTQASTWSACLARIATIPPSCASERPIGVPRSAFVVVRRFPPLAVAGGLALASRRRCPAGGSPACSSSISRRACLGRLRT